ncbi:MAG: hypothetical protein QG646_3901 [Euryarchaeota archaeon]|nr:hypothetical protein [Euryarchaeota archaeon]
MEYRFRKKDGSYIYIEDNSTFLKNESVRVGRNLGVMKDITERELNRQQLEKSEERFRIAAEQTGQVISDFKLETGEIEWARAIKEVTGYDPEEFISVINWQDIIYPEDRPIIFKEKKIQSPYNSYREIGFRIIRKDGRIRWVSVIYQKFKGREGNQNYYQGIIYDVTE